MQLVAVDTKAKRDQTLYYLIRDGAPVSYTGTQERAELPLSEWRERMYTGDYNVPRPARVVGKKEGGDGND